MKKLISKIGNYLLVAATTAVTVSLGAVCCIIFLGHTVVEAFRGRNALERKEE